MIVDSHVHVVSPDHERYPLQPRSLSGTWYLDAPCSAPQLVQEMAAAGVDQAVLVQGVGAYTYDNAYAVDSAVEDPARFVSAACIDVRAPDALARLDYWAGERGTQGVRLFSVRAEDAPIDDPATLAVWGRATERGLHVIATILPNQLDALETGLARFPDCAVSLDHCGFVDPGALDPLLRLSARANLHLKVTTHTLDHAAEARGGVAAMIERLIGSFGAERLMWGSDFSQTHDRPYAELVALGRAAFASRSEGERAACLGDTARRLWPGVVASD